MSRPFIDRRRVSVLSGLVLSALTFVAVAHASLLSSGPGEVQFKAVGPGGLKIEGSGSEMSAKEADGVVTLRASLKELKTGISLRDDHLKKAIHAEQHPEAVLVVPRSALKFPEDKQAVEAAATGKFTLNGTTKDLKFNYKVNRTGSDYHVQGLAEIDITDYKLEIPCYLGVCVEKDVKIKVKFKLREQ